MNSVSIQLVSPASGDLKIERNALLENLKVSIQLVSPASGDFDDLLLDLDLDLCFHSISFPSEWGLNPPWNSLPKVSL